MKDREKGGDNGKRILRMTGLNRPDDRDNSLECRKAKSPVNPSPVHPCTTAPQSNTHKGHSSCPHGAIIVQAPSNRRRGENLREDCPDSCQHSHSDCEADRGRSKNTAPLRPTCTFGSPLMATSIILQGKYRWSLDGRRTGKGSRWARER